MRSSNTPRRVGPPPVPNRQPRPEGSQPLAQANNGSRVNVAAVACAAIAGLCVMLLGGVAVVRLAMPMRGVAETTAEVPPEADPHPSEVADDAAAHEASTGAEAAKKTKAGTQEEDAHRQMKEEEMHRAQREAELAEEGRRQKEAEEKAADRKAQESNDAAKRRRNEAFGQFQALPETIPSDIPPSSSESLPIKLGLLNAEHLDGLRFEIAAPRERPGESDCEAWVEQDPKDKARWLLQARIKSAEDGAGAKTLAALSVTEGSLWLTPGKLSFGQRALLRRSVLLATATDPNHNGKLVTRGIQLLVPTETPAPFSTPLAGVHENADTIPFRPRAGITVPPSGTNAAPKLPLNAAVVEYTIAFPYDRKGDKKPVIHTNTPAEHGGSAYCALLEQRLPPDPKTTIGIDVALSQQGGVLSLRTKTDGPGASAVDFERLIEVAKRSDKSHKTFKNNIISAVKQFVAQLTKSTPVDYENKSQATLKKLSTLGTAQHFGEFEGDFGSFFAREKLFTKQVPDPKQPGTDKTVPEVVTNPDECCAIWNTRCQQIVADASRDPNPDPKKDIAEWNREFVDVIKRWATDWELRFEEYADTLRRCSQPLLAEATITVTRITSKAYAADGTEYIVVLSTPNGQGRQDDRGLAERFD
jgi:hypothetical protein